MVLGGGDVASPYTVLDYDTVVEFTEGGDVTCTLDDGVTETVTTVLAGARYAIGAGVTVISFDGKFSVS